MNVTEFNYLINKPSAINAEQVIKLEQLLKNFPYFQSAMSLYLKGLYAQDSFKYNQALKKTAAATTDRAVLFDFITSENFVPLQNKIFEDLTKKIMSINVIDSANSRRKKRANYRYRRKTANRKTVAIYPK